ncbi:MAG: SPOR domain-containing protein, partial [Gemmatimonadota bacterium]|nr:SPOR domain-containing protein [Gemmatimonadota bacterium]
RPARPSRPARETGRETPRRSAEPGGDPSTEELLGTLAGEPWYDRAEPPRPAAEPPSGEPARAANPRSDAPGVDDISILDDASEGPWTLQLGAYTSETGALVRIRQLERAFPKASRWYEGEAGMWRVYLGRWPDRQRAERARAAVAARGYVDAWVTRAP